MLGDVFAASGTTTSLRHVPPWHSASATANSSSSDGGRRRRDAVG